ncbi:hypothetical protein TRVA0_020S01662 [Trichomonascus vanleenenianus]|uniref:uncharacterized protein n=1 Tax=Trichomonascus vanleenenianus TaxID=2268995 RepID=UPI003EC9525B
MDNTITQVSVKPGYAIPGWAKDKLATAEFKSDESLECPIPGCIEVFRNDSHGRRYTAEKWKAHVTAKELHYYLWYDPQFCYQPRALRYTFIRVDKCHKIAVCHFRREPVQFNKLEEHCQRCKGCLGIDKRYANDPEYRAIRNVTKQQLQRDGVAIQGFEACEAYYCCTKLYGSSVQGIHAHMKTAGSHNPTASVKCMRYRTTKHGYAYVPISDLEYEKLNSVHDGMAVVEHPRESEWQKVLRSSSPDEPAQLKQGSSNTPEPAPPATDRRPSHEEVSKWKSRMESMEPSDTSKQGRDSFHTVDSFRQTVLARGYGLFENFYKSFIHQCSDEFDELTFHLQPQIIGNWMRDLRPIFDDLENAAPGYSFMADPHNVFASDHQMLYRFGIHDRVPFFQNLAKYDYSQVPKYLTQCQNFVRALAVLTFTSIANTPSPAELLSWSFANTPAQMRSMMLKGGSRLVFKSSTGVDRELPWVVSELVARYLMILRPLETYLNQVLQSSEQQVADLNSRLFVTYQGRISETELSNSMRQVTGQHLDRIASENVWKNLLHTIMHKVAEQQWPESTFSQAWFNSTGLSTLRLEDIPSLGPYQLLPKL